MPSPSVLSEVYVPLHNNRGQLEPAVAKSPLETKGELTYTRNDSLVIVRTLAQLYVCCTRNEFCMLQLF